MFHRPRVDFQVHVGIVHQRPNRSLNAWPIPESQHLVERRSNRRRTITVVSRSLTAIKEIVADTNSIGYPQRLAQFRFEYSRPHIDGRPSTVIAWKSVVSISRHRNRLTEGEGNAVIRNV